MSDVRWAFAVPGARRGAHAALSGVGAGVIAVLVALPFAGPGPVLVGLAVYGVLTLGVLAGAELAHPHAIFGAANVVTLVRGGGAAVFAALTVPPHIVVGPAGWLAFAAAAALLGLDGLDGRIARRQGTASAFGARFDLEVDALLILFLAVLAAQVGKAGPWVLGLGLLRYMFVLAGVIWPTLAAGLPPSLRRKAVCVVQVAALTLLLAPPVARPASEAIAATAFTLLAWSFALDIRWLVRTAR